MKTDTFFIADEAGLARERTVVDGVRVHSDQGRVIVEVSLDGNSVSLSVGPDEAEHLAQVLLQASAAAALAAVRAEDEERALVALSLDEFVERRARLPHRFGQGHAELRRYCDHHQLRFMMVVQMIARRRAAIRAAVKAHE